MNKYSFIALLFSLLSFTLQAQTSTNTYNQMMQQSNKMIAVILVLVIILLGVAAFLFYLDRKISKLEKNLPARSKETNQK